MERIEAPRFPDLVFTSAGPFASVARWVEGDPAFDLWITDYGGCDPALLGAAQYAIAGSGSKFQNLLAAWKAYPHVFQRYASVLVADDDLSLDAAAINRLFDVRREFDLLVLQPAFDPSGKISHGITRARPTARIRFTNFVEVTCPLFRLDALSAFLREYSPELSGYGIDWWYAELLGAGREDRLAIVDEVVCVNPLDDSKGGREIDRLQRYAERKAAWERIRTERGLAGERVGARTFRRIPASRAFLAWPLEIRFAVTYYARRAAAWKERIGRRLARMLRRGKATRPASSGADERRKG